MSLKASVNKSVLPGSSQVMLMRATQENALDTMQSKELTLKEIIEGEKNRKSRYEMQNAEPEDKSMLGQVVNMVVPS